MVRKAVSADIPAVVRIYDAILTEQEQGRASIGWIRGIYPTEQTARDALEAGELFVWEQDGEVLAAAKINREQVPEYALARWEHPAPDNEIMVLHTLVVDPAASGRGIGTGFVGFYERYAREQGCRFLRMDTNQINKAARNLYRGLGYKEVGIVPCCFNGIPDVQLVCLEKLLEVEK